MLAGRDRSLRKRYRPLNGWRCLSDSEYEHHISGRKLKHLPQGGIVLNPRKKKRPRTDGDDQEQEGVDDRRKARRTNTQTESAASSFASERQTQADRRQRKDARSADAPQPPSGVKQITKRVTLSTSRYFMRQRKAEQLGLEVENSQEWLIANDSDRDDPIHSVSNSFSFPNLS
jgi:hypothetical protein